MSFLQKSNKRLQKTVMDLILKHFSALPTTSGLTGTWTTYHRLLAQATFMYALYELLLWDCWVCFYNRNMREP